MAKETHWAAMRETGFLGGMRFLFAVYKLLGPLVFRISLYPVLLYYFISNKTARASSIEYLGRLKAFSPELEIKPTLATSFRHFFNFAHCLVDKLGAWADGIDLSQLTFPNRAQLQQHIDQGQGLVLLASHLGNLEICRCLGALNPTLRLNILVHTKHAGMFNRLLEKYSTAGQLELIQVSELTPATAIILHERVSQGEFVVIVGDRVSVDKPQQSIAQDFLGQQALFPQGPFILASLLQCPVYTLFCLKINDHYHIHAQHFANQITLPRKDRPAALAAYIAEYAARLEKSCTIAPLQWFNFFPFWGQAQTTIKKHDE